MCCCFFKNGNMRRSKIMDLWRCVWSTTAVIVTLGVTPHHQGPSSRPSHWFSWCHRPPDAGRKARKTDPRRAFSEFRMHCAGSIYSERDGSRMNLETMTPFSLRSNSSAPHVAFRCCRLNGFKAGICWLMELTRWHADYWTAFSSVHQMRWCGKCSTHLRALMGCNPVNQHIFTSYNKGI